LAGQVSYDERRWGHIYFIPIFPTGDKVRVQAECSACSRGRQVEQLTVPSLFQGIHRDLEKAIVAIVAGEGQVELNGHSVDVRSVIAANLKDLYCLGGPEEVDLFMEKLRAAEELATVLLAEALLAEIQGKRKKAQEKYQELCDLENTPQVRYLYASFLSDSRLFQKSIPVDEELEQELVTDLSVKQLLIDAHAATEQYDKQASIYESCFLIASELKENKKVLKFYKKAGRKMT